MDKEKLLSAYTYKNEEWRPAKRVFCTLTPSGIYGPNVATETKLATLIKATDELARFSGALAETLLKKGVLSDAELDDILLLAKGIILEESP